MRHALLLATAIAGCYRPPAPPPSPVGPVERSDVAAAMFVACQSRDTDYATRLEVLATQLDGGEIKTIEAFQAAIGAARDGAADAANRPLAELLARKLDGEFSPKRAAAVIREVAAGARKAGGAKWD